MTMLALERGSRALRNHNGISPLLRAIVATGGIVMTIVTCAALARLALGMVPSYGVQKDIALIIHLAAVLPAVPLGLYILLSRKGDARHKLLGRIWLILMVLTAASAIFIRNLNGGQFSFIHLFVPLTFIAVYETIATARKGNIKAHRKNLIGLYIGALLIPGTFSFLPDRLMNAWLLG